MSEKEEYFATATIDHIAATLEAKTKEAKTRDTEKFQLITKAIECMIRLADISFKDLTCPRIVVKWELEDNKKNDLWIKKEFGKITFGYYYMQEGKYSSEGSLENIDYQDAVTINMILSKIERIAPSITFY